MSAFDLLLHLLNFAAPAFFVALVLVLPGRWIGPRGAGPGLLAQLALTTLAGVLVLAGGLLLLGQDGRIATYAALVVVSATAHWLVRRGWR